MRRLTMIAVAVFAVSLTHFAPAASGAPGKPRLHATILTTGQNPLVNKRILKVKVRSARRGEVRVRGFSTTFDRRGKYYSFTRVARPRFRRARQVKIVNLRLTNAGVEAVRSCEDRDLQVRAGKVSSRIRSLVRQSSTCAPRPLDLARADRCEYIAEPTPNLCLNPFPSNYYTRADTSTETGRRVDLRTDAMPVNQAGKPINAAPYNESDGFSQGQTISVRVPGLDNFLALHQTNPPSLANPQRYLDPNVPVVVINSATGEWQPVWAELDSNATSDADRNLLIHPLVNFEPGARYIVALRGLEDASGATLQSPAGFRYYRDLLPSREIRINQRRSYFEDIFRRLRNQGIPRRDLYLAWDFTVASDENNSGRALSMRNQAFAELGDPNLSDRTIPARSTAPSFTVTSAEADPDPRVVRRIKGTFEVPCYLKNPGGSDPCGPGATINLNAAGIPVKTGTYEANFDCVVPHAVVDAPSAAPGRALVYGHGLLGDIGGEIAVGPQLDLADEHGFVVCGTDEIGMSSNDIGTVASALADLNDFPGVPDRLQQGLLNELYLARLMIHPDGLVSAPGFHVDPMDMGSDTVIDVSSGRAFYRGNGQGGILGGALTALAPDFDRVSLGVSAMNFSVLLNRSRAWETYSAVFEPNYQNEIERPLVLSLIQMLWDRGEPNGYAHRMTDEPLPDTPAHKVLMDVAFGDHLVTNWQSNVMARTIGARAVNPFVYSGRWPGVDGQWGIDPIEGYPFDGSAIAYFDSGPLRADPMNPGDVLGTIPPPVTNVTPVFGVDPHEDPRRADTAQQMVSDFLKTGGRVSNPCA
ncbi:MAG: hypothetical protein ACSLFD_10850, partial [Solirubrobacterales bacterium]